MVYRSSIAFIALLLAVNAASVDVRAADTGKYPDWKGAWSRIGAPRWDAGKPEWKQEPPLTQEYQAIYEANVADMREGGQGVDPTFICLAPGMPRSMIVYHPMEIVITPDTTYILIDHIHDSRRIYTDGRDWPRDADPAFAGYSIGTWIDSDGTGRYDTLEVETRRLKGPRTFDATGIPLHRDNETIIKERIYRDRKDAVFLVDEITTIDHALTRPWTVVKRYQHEKEARPHWIESVCAENNNHVAIGGEGYMLSADGLLMPAKKGQVPPDLRYFGQKRN